MESLVDTYQRVVLCTMCPVCNEYMDKRIYNCSKGHSMCDRCQALRKKCSFCKSPVTTTRNRCLEAIIDQLAYPCKNISYGCNEKMRLEDMFKHSLFCCHQLFSWDNRSAEKAHVIKSFDQYFLISRRKLNDTMHFEVQYYGNPMEFLFDIVVYDHNYRRIVSVGGLCKNQISAIDNDYSIGLPLILLEPHADGFGQFFYGIRITKH